MISVAPFRFRNVLAAAGGPVARIETGLLPVRGRQVFLANATLVDGLARKEPLCLFSDAHGSGTHREALVARHKAVAEAMERWAFHRTVRSDRAAEFGFDIDPSSTGMAAFPGIFRRQARRLAVLEAIERWTLIAWWDGLLPASPISTDWPGVSALTIEGPPGGVTVVVWAKSQWGGYVYGHAAEESIGAACEHAVVELARHEWVLRGRWLREAVEPGPAAPANVFEQRCLFFAGEEGHALFLERVAARPGGRGRVKPVVICDAFLPGPWSRFATVWRFAFRPPSSAYRLGGERYFFL